MCVALVREGEGGVQCLGGSCVLCGDVVGAVEAVDVAGVSVDVVADVEAETSKLGDETEAEITGAEDRVTCTGSVGGCRMK